MGHPDKRNHKHQFVSGELYLFHETNRLCPAETSLWAIFDKIEDEIIYLESFTLDLRHFNIWRRLPANYQYSRRATRCELRDYMYNMGIFDAHKHCLDYLKRQL